MAWLHPILGLAAVVAMLVTAKLGLDARRGNARARRWHRRLRAVVLGLTGLAGVGGLLSMALLRPDLHLRDAPGTSPIGHTAHFWAALVTVVALGLAATVQPGARQNPVYKRVHPVLGLTACAGAVLAVLLGLRMLP